MLSDGLTYLDLRADQFCWRCISGPLHRVDLASVMDQVLYLGVCSFKLLWDLYFI